MKMGSGDCQSPSQLPNQNFKQRLVDWDNAVNAVYKGPVNDHGKDFRKVFPLLSSPIANNILKSQSRTITPDWSSCSTPIAGLNLDLGNTVRLWEAHSCNSFMNGLCPDARGTMKSSCMGWETACIEEIRRHAQHTEKNIREKRQKMEDKQKKELHMAA